MLNDNLHSQGDLEKAEDCPKNLQENPKESQDIPGGQHGDHVQNHDTQQDTSDGKLISHIRAQGDKDDESGTPYYASSS